MREIKNKSSFDGKVIILNSLYYPNVGGVENSVTEMVKVFLERGASVLLICSDRNYVNAQVLLPSENLDNFTIFRYSYPYGIIGFFKQYINCINLIGKNYKKGDVVISRSHITTICARLAGVRNIKYIVPSVVYKQDRKNVSWWRFKSVGNYFFNSLVQCISFWVSDVFVFSTEMKSQVKSGSLGVNEATLIRPGVSLKRFSPPDSRQRFKLKERFGLSHDARVILCLGRFSELKQFEIAIQSMRFLSHQYHLFLVGDGPRRNEYNSLVSDFGLAGRVSVLDVTHEPELFYQGADLFLMTSRYEAFGQVLLEATACGLPILAFSSKSGVVTASENIYRNTKTLINFCENQNPESLSNAISSYFDSSEKVDFFERKKLIEKFSWSSMLDDVLGNKKIG